MSADKEAKRSILVPLVDIPYEFEGVESAEDRAEQLEREKEKLQILLDAALKAQEEPDVPTRSRAEADDPGAREGQKVAEEGKQAKAEADKLVDKANKQVIYERIDTCLSEYDTLDRRFAGSLVCTGGSTGEMHAALRMSGVFTDVYHVIEESSGKLSWKLLDLLQTAPGFTCNTEAFTGTLKCMSADKEAKRSIRVPLVDTPYEFEEVESAEDRAE